MNANTSATGGTLLPVVRPETLAINDEALDSLFRNQVAAITGIYPQFVVERYSSEPLAPPPAAQTWAAVGVTEIDDDQFPAQGLQADGTYKLVRHERLGVLCSFYGPKAQQAARMLRDGVLITQNIEALLVAGIAFREASRPLKVPALINGTWSNRIDVTLTFGRAVVEIYPILTITHVAGGTVTDNNLFRLITD